jgi:hypothetical protein
MTPARGADQVLLTHIRECLDRIREYIQGERSNFFASHLDQAVTRRQTGLDGVNAP